MKSLLLEEDMWNVAKLQDDFIFTVCWRWKILELKMEILTELINNQLVVMWHQINPPSQGRGKIQFEASIH